MNGAPETAVTASLEPASLELRLAQRAFAAIADARARAGEFRLAQLRSAAARTLSALSADDRSRLARWIALVVGAGRRRDEEAVLGLFARVDTALAARVRRELAYVLAELARADKGRVVAA